MARVLLVDDDELIRFTLSKVLELNGFEITAATCVSEAIRLISSEPFDVLLSDLHMPEAGDGLTVVSAMRHCNPRAVTMLLSGFPEMMAATNAILMQADAILVKPMKMDDLVEVIKNRLSGSEELLPRKIEMVSDILTRMAEETIDNWYDLVEGDDKLNIISLSQEIRCFHLPQLFRDLVHRLLVFKPLGSREWVSVAAAEHGIARCRQGYSAAMIVEESRILQVSIFKSLQDNLSTIDFSTVLQSVMTIADECDSQLSQSMRAFIAECELQSMI
jgi:ActR/RegA family two-component response regulator